MSLVSAVSQEQHRFAESSKFQSDAVEASWVSAPKERLSIAVYGSEEAPAILGPDWQVCEYIHQSTISAAGRIIAYSHTVCIPPIGHIAEASRTCAAAPHNNLSCRTLLLRSSAFSYTQCLDQKDYGPVVRQAESLGRKKARVTFSSPRRHKTTIKRLYIPEHDMSTSQNLQVPMVDLSLDDASAAAQLYEAASSVGFFYGAARSPIRQGLRRIQMFEQIAQTHSSGSLLELCHNFSWVL